MRSDVKVNKTMVFAVVLSDVAGLTFTDTTIRKALTHGKYGFPSDSKDFLKPGEVEIVVHRGPKSVRRRCDFISFTSVDEDYRMQLLSCELSLFITCCI